MQGDEMTAVQPITRGGRVTVGGDLMVFSHLRWNWVWQRPQHIVSRLAERFDRTIFVEEPEAVPSAKRAQLRSEVCGRVERLWLEVPGPTGHCDFDDVRANDYGRMIAERFGTTPSIAWLYTPIALPLAEAMAPEVLVFDVMDDLAAFAHAAPQLRFANALAVSSCDVVFTGGRSLQRSTLQHRPDASCFPSGVELEHFSRAISRRPTSRDRPVAGYVGVLDERLDLALLERLATVLDDWDIQMVGPITKIDPATLPTAPNLTYFGPRSYGQLPEVMAGFDVALMPFALNESTRSISPTKSLEYLAAGLPVVSTRVPDVVAELGSFVALADDGDQFAAACRRLLAGDRPADNAVIQALLRWNQWDAIVDRMWGELSGAQQKLIETAAL
jgi:glycosyltransferase involved in cell wall biosynthesis